MRLAQGESIHGRKNMLALDKFFGDAVQGSPSTEPPPNTPALPAVQRLDKSWRTGPDPDSASNQALPEVLAPEIDLSGLFGKQDAQQPIAVLNPAELGSAERDLDDLLARQSEIGACIEARKQALRASVLADMRARIQKYSLTAHELGFDMTAGNSHSPHGEHHAKGQRVRLAPKYLDPATGRTWSGHGRTPEWLKDQDRSAFRIALGA
jgi:DNA-binding protein H-NS